MVSLNWKQVMDADPSDLDNDGADDFFDMLEKYDPEADKDINLERLHQLFKLVQSVMCMKNKEIELVLEEVGNKAKEDEKSGAMKEQELTEEINSLRSEMKNLKKFGPDTAASTPGTSYLREELRELERQNEELMKDFTELQRDLTEEKRASEMYSVQNVECEKEKKELRREIDQMRQDVNDYKMQMQSQKDILESCREGDKDYREKLTRKNLDLTKAVEELQNLTDVNEELEKRCEDLHKNLQDAVKQMEATTEDYLKLKTDLQMSDSVIDKLRGENEVLRTQVSDLTDQVHSKADSDDAIMVAVSNKIEDWKKILSDKDEQIVGLSEKMYQLRQQLIGAEMDSDKASVAVLSKVLKEKEKQIEELTENMKQYSEEMETNVAIIEDLKYELSRVGIGPGDRLQQKIREQQTVITNQKKQLKEAEQRVEETESHAIEKDQNLAEALKRMKQYEAGEYGLPEAVAEIKVCKNQMKLQDRQIEELTQHINKTEMKLNDMAEENEGLRNKLGIEPSQVLDLDEFRKNKMNKKEEERALNIVLHKEIEQLEEERIELKNKIRKLAQKTGQRAVALGLTASDMMAIQDFTEDLRDRRQTLSSAAIIKKEVAEEELKMKHRELDEHYHSQVQKFSVVQEENIKVKSQNKQLQEENKYLEAGLKEIKEQISDHDLGDKGNVFECPSLEKMLNAIEARNVLGNYDSSVYLKAQVDNLLGRNDELRSTLREARHETNMANLEAEKAMLKIKKLEGDLKVYQEAGGMGALFQALPLPEGMVTSSSDVISSLNEHLVVTLQELSLKEEMIKKMESSLQNYQRKFSVMRHQQGLLYQDYNNNKQAWESGMNQLKEQLQQLEGSREEDLARLQEYDRLVDTLAQDEVEVRRRLSEMTRRVTILQVNEKALIRRYNTVEESEGYMRKEINKLKNEMIVMEKTVAERLGYLQRYKDTASFRIACLQKALENSVPAADLDCANKEYQVLTEKYRDLLERENVMVTQSDTLTALQDEVKQLTEENDQVKKILAMEKEKLHTLEAAMENVQGKGGQLFTDDETLSISKRITMLEMKELNERQRAEHAVHMYEQQNQTVRNLEDRNKEVEEKFAEVAKMNLEQQKTEQALRDELSNSVTKAVSDADRQKISKLELSEVILKEEISKLKEISDVATTQVKALESQQVSREKEVQSLRQQLLDFQVQSDEKIVIGKLHRHIVQLQISEGTAVQKLEDSRKKVSKLEAQVLRLEQHLDEKSQTIYHIRTEAQNRTKQLKRSLHGLRRQFAGAIPLSRQEKFSKAMVQLQENKLKTEKELKEVREQRANVEDKLAALQLQHSGLQELMATLKDGRSAQKVVEWHSKMESLRLEEMQQKRHIGKLCEQIQFLEKNIKSHEASIVNLEADSVRLANEFDEKQFHWEQREVELERTIANMEKQAAEIARAASQFEETVGTLPDFSLPVARQLDQAIATIKSNKKLILDAQAEATVYKKQVQELEKNVKEAEEAILSRDKLVAELRLRMPATADRDEIIMKATSKVTQAMRERAQCDGDFESSQALKIAQSTVTSLKARIKQKEETIEKYQELLKMAHEDMEKMNHRHDKELREMQQRMHMKTDQSFHNFKQTVRELINKKSSNALPSDQLDKMKDVVAEHENAMSVMVDRMRNKDDEILSLRMKIQQTIRQMDKEKDKILERQNVMVSKKDDEILTWKQKVQEQKKDVSILNEEIAVLKEANSKAPTTNMKRLVEQLKNQVALKENQHQALTKALSELRANMVIQAEEALKSHAKEASQELNIQKLLDKHTKELTDQLDEQQNEVKRLKTELKKRRTAEQTLNTELEDIKDELSRKVSVVHKLKVDKQKLEQKVEELEKRIDRLNSVRSQKQTDGDAQQQELNDTRRRVHYLEEELKKFQLQAEKPYEQTRSQKVKSEELAKWEEGKKLQRTVDRMKSKIKEKEEEVEKLQKESKLLKNALDRANRNKELQMQTITKSHTTPTTTPRKKIDLGNEDLKLANFQLTEEVAQLKYKLMTAQDISLEEMQHQNKHLKLQVEQLQEALAAKFQASQDQSTREYQQLFERNQQLQKDMLKVSEENIELRFEVEQARKDLPRFKTRIDDLQDYIEVLKDENVRLGGNTSARSEDSSSSSVKKVGESGKSTKELEKIISLLKKVVERVQAENKDLKKSVAVEQLESLKDENKTLMFRLHEFEKKLGTSLSDPGNEKATAKLICDYEKLRKDFLKETEAKKKLQLHCETLETVNSKLSKQIDKAWEKLEVEEGVRQSTINSIETRSGQKKYVDKLKQMEAELEKKTKTISDMKKLLQESVGREQTLLHENEKLLEKIHILEKYPLDSNASKAEITRDYQQARLTINRLEDEKTMLLHELKSFQQHQDNPTEVMDTLLEKARHYDKVLRESVEVQLHLKTAELERDKLKIEVHRLKRELANFGPDFFEEIEDLKYNFKEAVKKNILYEEKLQMLSRQFGVTISIPGLD